MARKWYRPTASGWAAWDTPAGLVFPAGVSAFHPAFLNQFASWANTLFGNNGPFYANGTPLFQPGTVFGGMQLGAPVSGDISDFNTSDWLDVANLAAGGTVAMADDIGNPYESEPWQWCRENGVIDASGRVSLLVGEEIQPNSAFAVAALVHLREVLDAFVCKSWRGTAIARGCSITREWIPDWQTDPETGEEVDMGEWGPNQTSAAETADGAYVPIFSQEGRSGYARYPVRIRYSTGIHGKIALLTQHTLDSRRDPGPPHHCDAGCPDASRSVHGKRANDNNWFVAGVFDLADDTGGYTKIEIPQGTCWQDVLPIDSGWKECKMALQELWLPADVPTSLPPEAVRVPYP